MVEQMQESQINASARKIGEGAKELKDAVTDTAKEKFGELKDTAREKFGEYSEQASNMIHENPLASLAIAFGVGALFGMLFFRRD